jgi:hypothetical protein
MSAGTVLSFVNLCNTGFWYCTGCERVSEPAGDDPGAVNRRCAKCGGFHLVWTPPVVLTDYKAVA